MVQNSDSTTSQGIPIRTRKADPNLPLPSSYSTTPHGTIFSTTPGGTRIIYDRNTLLNLRNSPLSRTPPMTLGHIPGVTKPSSSFNNHSTIPVHHTPLQNSFSPIEDNSEDEVEKADKGKAKAQESGDVFEMEME